MSSATASCSACGQTKDVSAFERTPSGNPRKECKECRKAKRAEAAAKAKQEGSHARDPAAVPKPSACSGCGKGPDQVEFKWRTDVMSGGWRAVCNGCYNEKGYHKEYRKRELEKDAAAYRKRNAEAHLAWAHRNPDKVKEQQELQRTSVDRKFKGLVMAAKQRGIEVDIGDSANILKDRLAEPCFFCAFQPAPGEVLNGLSRYDLGMGFTTNNAVACCATCSAMKRVMNVDEFLGCVRRIYDFRRIADAQASSSRARLPAFGGRADLRNAEEKVKMDLLTVAQKIQLWGSPCYLCGRGPALGIDREDANGDYTPQNARPCCTECNYMKKDMNLVDFDRHIAYVYEHTHSWVLKDMMDLPLKISIERTRDPVGMLDHSGVGVAVVFPSVNTAAAVLGAKTTSIAAAVGAANKTCCGRKWVNATPRAYRQQAVDRTTAIRNILSARACREEDECA